MRPPLTPAPGKTSLRQLRLAAFALAVVIAQTGRALQGDPVPPGVRNLTDEVVEKGAHLPGWSAPLPYRGCCAPVAISSRPGFRVDPGLL
jgi:hypothetical protein